MTIVRVRYTPPGGPVPGFIRARPQHDEDNRPLVTGRDIISGDTGWLEVPVEGMELDLRPSEAGWHYAIQGKAEGAPSFSVTKLVPQTGPVDFGDLVDYNPKAGMAYEPDPPWYAHLNSLEAGLDGTQEDLHAARDLAVASASGAAISASTALGARDQAQQARDETVALGLTIDTSAGTKVSVGTVVVYYNSGWRNISNAVPSWGWINPASSMEPDEGVWVRRLLDTIQVRVVGTVRTAQSATIKGEIVWGIPATFYPRFPEGAGQDDVPIAAVVGRPGSETTFIYSRRSSTGRVWVDRMVPVGTKVNFVATIPIETGLPTSLPGTPA